jgi:hypothetical protein
VRQSASSKPRAQPDWERKRYRSVVAAPKVQTEEGSTMRYALLWLLGVPIPLLIVIALLFN